MDITVADRPIHGAVVITLHGELGIDAAGALRTALDDLISRSITRIVIDLGPLTFCDSVGLSAFVDTHHRCAQRGGYLRLAAASPFLQRVLTVVGLLGRIPVYDTVQAACTADASRLTRPPGPIPRQLPDGADLRDR